MEKEDVVLLCKLFQFRLGILIVQKLHFVKLVMDHYALQEPWNRKLQNFWKLYQNPFFRFIFDLNLTW
jgi:hypothetical protein